MILKANSISYVMCWSKNASFSNLNTWNGHIPISYAFPLKNCRSCFMMRFFSSSQSKRGLRVVRSRNWSLTI